MPVAVMRVTEKHGMALVYDTEDVADTSISTPHDVNSHAVDGAGHHELGTAHLHLDISFLPGKGATWVRLSSEQFSNPRTAGQTQGGQ